MKIKDVNFKHVKIGKLFKFKREWSNTIKQAIPKGSIALIVDMERNAVYDWQVDKITFLYNEEKIAFGPFGIRNFIDLKEVVCQG